MAHLIACGTARGVALAALALAIAPLVRAEVLIDPPAVAARPPAAPAVPAVRTVNYADICDIRVEAGRLAVKITAPQDGPRTFRVEGLPGPGTATISPAVQSIRFSVTADGNSSSTYISRTALRTSLQRSYISAQQTRSINVIQQDVKDGAAGGDPLRLTISTRDNQNGQMLENFTAGAADLRALRREHPAEFRDALVPLLRDLGARGAFAADPEIAARAFPAGPTGAALSARVTELVKALDADAYAERIAAEAELRRLPIDAADQIDALDPKRLSVQQRLTLQQVVPALRAVSRSRITRLRDDRTFLLDCLYLDDPRLRQAAHARLEHLAGRPLPLDLNAPEDDRVAAIESLRTQLAPTTRAAPKS